MREEVQEMSREKRRALYHKKMKQYEWCQIILPILIIIAGILAVRQLILLDVTVERYPILKKAIAYLVAMITFAGYQLSFRFGQHIFKTTPWMIEFSENKRNPDGNNIEETETGEHGKQ